MTQISDEIKYRLAASDDDPHILAVLEEVAPEIPVQIDGEERQDRIRTIIAERRMSRKSWVAVNANGKVVGFALARPDVVDQRAAIFLDYIGVSADARRQGICSGLMKKLKANNVPVTADVLQDNRSGMASHLVKQGFVAIEQIAKQTRFRWDPAQPEKSLKENRHL